MLRTTETKTTAVVNNNANNKRAKQTRNTPRPVRTRSRDDKNVLLGPRYYRIEHEGDNGEGKFVEAEPSFDQLQNKVKSSVTLRLGKRRLSFNEILQAMAVKQIRIGTFYTMTSLTPKVACTIRNDEQNYDLQKGQKLFGHIWLDRLASNRNATIVAEFEYHHIAPFPCKVFGGVMGLPLSIFRLKYGVTDETDRAHAESIQVWNSNVEAQQYQPPRSPGGLYNIWWRAPRTQGEFTIPPDTSHWSFRVSCNYVLTLHHSDGADGQTFGRYTDYFGTYATLAELQAHSAARPARWLELRTADIEDAEHGKMVAERVERINFLSKQSKAQGLIAEFWIANPEGRTVIPRHWNSLVAVILV